jgi:hypothetical protein
MGPAALRPAPTGLATDDDQSPAYDGAGSSTGDRRFQGQDPRQHVLPEVGYSKGKEKFMGLKVGSDPSVDDGTGLSRFGGSRPSFFPHGHRREERLTSRLITTLESVRPFAQRFFDSLDIQGRRPTSVTRNLGGYRAFGLVEPRLGDTRHRADAAISLRYGTFEPWRCAFEVKYLSEGRNSRPTAVKLSKEQVGRTYESARCANFDHVVTISADQPDGRRNPSGFEPKAEHLSSTGLSHISWLKVLWVLRETRVKDAKSLTSTDLRVLSDFESYLQRSNIWKHAREVSLGAHFASVRRHCNEPSRHTPGDIAMHVADVAAKWLQLTESIAQRLSIETDTLVHANGRRPNPEAVVRGILGSGTLLAEFKTETADDGHLRIEVDLITAKISSAWEVKIPRLLSTSNPQARTRWMAILALLSDWPAFKGNVTVLDSRRKQMIGPTRWALAADSVNQAMESSMGSPEWLRISRSRSAAARGTLRGDTLASVVEQNALSITPWR